eukprot:366562-Chlamydomonas_euryale.AAC.1
MGGNRCPSNASSAQRTVTSRIQPFTCPPPQKTQASCPRMKAGLCLTHCSEQALKVFGVLKSVVPHGGEAGRAGRRARTSAANVSVCARGVRFCARADAANGACVAHVAVLPL